MPPTPPQLEPSPNAPYIACWNDILAPKWLRYRHLLSGNGQIHSDVAYPQLQLRPGDHVLDVASGFGENSLELAQRVGSSGRVLGLDCTEAFVQIARREGAAAQVTNVEYLSADIETAPLKAECFDLAVSRFGLMFCASPVRALRAVARALKPKAQVALITWRSLADNPCWKLAEEIALAHLPAPGADGATCGPGLFALSDADTNTRILHAAGFEQVEAQRIDRKVCVGRTLEEAGDYQMAVGPAAFVIREAGDRSLAAHAEIQQALRRLHRRHQRADGSVWLDSSTWFVTARRPAA